MTTNPLFALDKEQELLDILIYTAMPSVTVEYLQKVKEAKHADSLVHAFFYEVHSDMARRALLAGHEYEGVFSWLRVEKRPDVENYYYFVWPDEDDYESYVMAHDRLFGAIGYKPNVFEFFEKTLVNEAKRKMVSKLVSKN